MPKYYGRSGFSARRAGTGYRVQRFGDTSARSAKYQAGVAARRAASRKISQALADPMLQNVVMRGAPSPGELKYKDFQAISTCVAVGNPILLNGIARGDEAFERSGRQITMKSVQIRLLVRGPTAVVAAGLQSFNACRFILFVDRQANATTPTMAQLLTDTTAGAACASNYNPEYKRRFYVIADMVVTSVQMFMTAANLGPACAHRKIVRFLNMPVEYNNGDAGTIADINTNSLYLYVIGDRAAVGAGGDHQVTISSRLTFTDN